MRVLGIIAEYNPFHNGHAYQMTKAQDIIDPDATIVIMSGNFTQRGEPAIVDKWVRAGMALINGANLVLELPFVCAASSAERFSEAAVGILAGSGMLTHLSFGTETESIDSLSRYAQVLEDEPDEYREYLKLQLDKGAPYARAADIALNQYLNGRSEPGLLNTPNSILGVQYLRHLHRFAPDVRPVPILRSGSGYHDKLDIDGAGNIASASGIRERLNITSENCQSDIERFMPHSAYELLVGETRRTGGAMSWRSFESTLLTIINQTIGRTCPVGIAEGLENRILRASESARSIDDMLARLKTKRYHRTRLQRILLHFLMGLNGYEIDEIFDHQSWRYCRVLGFDRKGRSILAHMRDNAEIPIITKLDSTAHRSDIWPCLKWDIRATDIYSYHYNNTDVRIPRRDFRTNPVMVQ